MKLARSIWITMDQPTLRVVHLESHSLSFGRIKWPMKIVIAKERTREQHISQRYRLLLLLLSSLLVWQTLDFGTRGRMVVDMRSCRHPPTTTFNVNCGHPPFVVVIKQTNCVQSLRGNKLELKWARIKSQNSAKSSTARWFIYHFNLLPLAAPIVLGTLELKSRGGRGLEEEVEEEEEGEGLDGYISRLAAFLAVWKIPSA